MNSANKSANQWVKLNLPFWMNTLFNAIFQSNRRILSFNRGRDIHIWDFARRKSCGVYEVAVMLPALIISD